MKNLIIDIVGAALLCVGVASVAGCVERSVRDNLQPLVAVTGNYGVWSGAVEKPKPPAPSGVCSACKGAGKVLERPDKPDLKVYITCAACGGTGKAKTKSEAPCVTGTCRPATRSTGR